MSNVVIAVAAWLALNVVVAAVLNARRRDETPPTTAEDVSPSRPLFRRPS